MCGYTFRLTRLVKTDEVRWLVEFVLQVIDWATLAPGARVVVSARDHGLGSGGGDWSVGDVLGGLAAVAGLLLICAVPIVLSVRPRPVQDVVTPASAGSAPGLVIHPDRGHWLLRPLGWIFIGGVCALGVWYVGSAPYAAAFFVVAGAYLLYSGWAHATGRAGDGTIRLTPNGIHQLWGGSELLVPWDEVRGLVTTPKELIIETRRRVQPRRTLPLLGGRRAVEEDAAVSMPHRFLPPLPYQEMIEMYSTSPTAREELATDEPVERARRLLREARGESTS